MDRTLRGRNTPCFSFFVHHTFYSSAQQTDRNDKANRNPEVEGLSFIVINPYINPIPLPLHSHTLFLCLLKLTAHGILADMMDYFSFTLLRSVHGNPPKNLFFLSLVCAKGVFPIVHVRLHFSLYSVLSHIKKNRRQKDQKERIAHDRHFSFSSSPSFFVVTKQKSHDLFPLIQTP